MRAEASKVAAQWNNRTGRIIVKEGCNNARESMGSATTRRRHTPLHRSEIMHSPKLKQSIDIFAWAAIVSMGISAGALPAQAQQSGASSAQPAQTRQQVQPGKVQTGPNGQFTLRTSVTEVVLYATVVDSHEHLVTTLQKQDFTVYEDNVPQVISSFRQEDVPVSLAILVDNSGSMSEKRAAVNRAAIDLVRASNPQDESFIVNFSDEAFLDQDFTSNIGLLEKGLSHIDSKGGTALYDAIVAAADHLSKNAKRAKQVILIITDGEDNSSSTTLAETVQRIQALHGPIVYSIGLLYANQNGREAHRARKDLQTLSDQTGGIAFFPKSLDQVDSIAAEVARDIREQYIIGYHPTKPISQGGYRTIRVVAKAKGFGKLTVRTRAGYFAQQPANSGQPGAAASSSGTTPH
jgi:Ca-activated chloride channel family protein